MPRSVSRTAVVFALLALFAAPVARAALELGSDAHACCPQPEAPRDAPCQQIAASSCCLEIGVPATPSGDEATAAPLLALALPRAALPAAPALVLRAVLTQADGPPLPPLLQSGVLLI